MPTKKAKDKKKSKPKSVSAKALKNWNCELAGKSFDFKNGEEMKLSAWEFEKFKNAGIVE